MRKPLSLSQAQATNVQPARGYRETLRLFTLMFSVLSCCSAIAQTGDRQTEIKPFPQNRVVDFYAKQAEMYLSSKQPIPPILPQYPGMDGGGFGHWGQNSEESSADYTLNQVETGNVVAHVIHHFGSVTNKAVAVHLRAQGGQSVLFDPEKLTFVDAWKDGFLFRHAGRFGTMGGVRAEGTRTIDLTAGAWVGTGDAARKYYGVHRRGLDACFRYHIGGAEIRDWTTSLETGLVRTIHIEGALPEGAQLQIAKLTDTTTGAAWVVGNNADGRCVVGVRSSTANGGSPAQLTSQDGLVAVVPARAETQTFTILMSPLGAGQDARALYEQELTQAVADAMASRVQSELTDAGPGQWVDKTTTTHLLRGEKTRASPSIPSKFHMMFRMPFEHPCDLGSWSIFGWQSCGLYNHRRRLDREIQQGDIWARSGAGTGRREER